MGPLRAVFILAVIYVACSWDHAHAAQPKVKEFTSGEGKCESDLDCGGDGKGICANKDGKDAQPSDEDEANGKCVCETGRTGAHCESEDKKPAGRRHKIYGIRKTNQAAEKRQMKFDLDLKATGLDPEEVQKAEQSVLFFHPRTGRYVEVSDDTRSIGSEKGNQFLKLDSTNIGKKLFRLEKGDKDNSYYIAARDKDDTETTGYVYMSTLTKGVIKPSNRMMLAKTKDKANAFIFMENNDQHGVYKLKYDGKFVYGSAGDFHVKADDRDKREKSEEIWFQLNVKPVGSVKKEDIQVEVKNTKTDAFSREDDLEVQFEEYDNGNDEDLVVKLNKQDTINKVKTKFDKLVASGNAGLKGGPASIGLSVSNERSTTDVDGKTSSDGKSFDITVPKNSKVCVEYSFRVRARYDEKELTITIKGKTGDKTFKGYSISEHGTGGDVKMALNKIPRSEKCK